MSDSNKKSILDFVARSNQQFALKRKFTSNNNNNNSTNTNDEDRSSVPVGTGDSSETSSNNNNVNATSSSASSNFLTPAQLMQQRLLSQQTGSFYSNNNNANKQGMMGPSSSSSTTTGAATSSSIISSILTGKPSSSATSLGKQELVNTWEQKIRAFIEDGTQTKMECPTLLSGADRREIHLLAGKFNLSHASVGAGTQRRLILTKDALFYQGVANGMNNANNNSNNNNQEQEQEQKTKGQLRRERQEKRENQNEKDFYADKAAYKALQKYSAAVNPFAKAVQMTEEEEQQMMMEQQDFTSSSSSSNNNMMEVGAGISNNTNTNDREPRRRQRNEQENNQQQDDEDDEVVPVDDDTNTKQIIASTLPDPEWMTPDQIEEASRLNEIQEDDIAWIRDFAYQCAGADDTQNNRTQRIVFCIDFSDFATSCTFITRMKAQRQQNQKFAMVALVADQKNGGESSDEFVCLKEKFDSVIRRIVAQNSNRENEICLCLPGNPLFGEALQVAVAFPISSSNDDENVQSYFGSCNINVDSISTF